MDLKQILNHKEIHVSSFTRVCLAIVLSEWQFILPFREQITASRCTEETVCPEAFGLVHVSPAHSFLECPERGGHMSSRLGRMRARRVQRSVCIGDPRGGPFLPAALRQVWVSCSRVSVSSLEGGRVLVASGAKPSTDPPSVGLEENPFSSRALSPPPLSFFPTAES